MKKNKGFTLIELFAVIIILAIIALIAIPIVLNIIEKARNGTFKNSAYGIIEATKLDLLELTSSNKKIIYPVIYSYKNGILYDSLGNKISISGSIESGEGKVVYYSANEFELAVYDTKYCARYTNTSKEVEISKKGESCRLSFEEGIIVYDLSVLNLESNASLIMNQYDKEKIYISAELPNIDSNITYEVKIANYSDILYDLSNIVVEIDKNDFIKYEILGIEKGDMIEPNTTKVLNIKLFYETSILPSNIIESLTLKFEFEEHISSFVVDTFDYSGYYEEFIVPYDGIYRIELWGAGGEVYEYVYPETVGRGAYTSGEIYLLKDSSFFVYVGGIENFNGGGPGEAGGGGATDIRYINGEWNNFESLKSRIMVAAGGGGGIIKQWNEYIYTYEGNSPGHGGGLIGYDANYNVTNALVTGFEFSGHGATQIEGGQPGKASGYYELNPETKGGFGYGGYANAYVEGLTIYNHSSGGGSGYYGGGHGVHTNSSWTGGGGGSSFISGHDGCDAILESSTEDNIIHTGQSIHYSGYQFTNTVMIDGDGYNWTTSKGEKIGMPTHDEKSTMIGNIGNGFAKITFIERVYN